MVGNDVNDLAASNSKTKKYDLSYVHPKNIKRNPDSFLGCSQGNMNSRNVHERPYIVITNSITNSV